MVDKFDDLEFFMGESCDAEAMHAILWYNEDDTPLMYFIKEGLEEEKVVSDSITNAIALALSSNY